MGEDNMAVVLAPVSEGGMVSRGVPNPRRQQLAVAAATEDHHPDRVPAPGPARGPVQQPLRWWESLLWTCRRRGEHSCCGHRVPAMLESCSATSRDQGVDSSPPYDTPCT